MRYFRLGVFLAGVLTAIGLVILMAYVAHLVRLWNQAASA
jgi:hypothetical protein